MKRVSVAVVILGALLATASTAWAAPPAVGPVSATNVQGVSAVLGGSVDPMGLATTYSFEYSTEASFAGVHSTPEGNAGDGSGFHPARAAIAGLAPATTYHVRLRATNSSGSEISAPATFTTTEGFGFRPGEEGFAVSAVADGGQAATEAGVHPYALEFKIGLKLGGESEGQPGGQFPDGDLRDLHLEAPPGLLENPSVLPRCTLAQFHTQRETSFEASRSGENCPDKTQVGSVAVHTSVGSGDVRRFGVFNLEPAPGVPAQLGFSPYGAPIILNNNLRPGTDGSYTLTLDANNMPQSLDLSGIELTLWGTPWAASHNGERGNCLNELEPGFPWGKCSVGPPRSSTPLSYLTLPHKCSGPLAFTARATSWQQTGEAVATAVNRDAADHPAEMGSCSGFKFESRPEGVLSDTKASSPSGYQFSLTVENSTLFTPTQRAPVPAKKAVVTLPDGVTINPSAGAGLGVCNPAQYASETAFSPQGAGCPSNSKIGSFSVRTPLFAGEELLDGAIYLAQPDDPATATAGAENPFNSLIALYLVAKRPNRGLLIKVAGRIDPDHGSGRLTATFDGLPRLPYTDLQVTFHTGQRAFLVTPSSCGPATTVSELTPWAQPEGEELKPVQTTSQISSGIGGGPCPSGTPPFNPSVYAGGVNSNVNAYTPYFVHISRKDFEQEITSYSLVLPKGITGKLAGIPFCPDAAIEAARTTRGATEAAHPSCPAASEVGHTISGYGVGGSLTDATGKMYLAGPYNGQPLSLVAINPATVGPFDLGTIVIRSAFSVDPLTAQLQIDRGASDPIPHILDGIPIHLRDIRIYMDRPEFTHNPSSCAAGELISTLGGSGPNFESTDDDSLVTAPPEHFQLLNCLRLGFKPKLGVRLRGGTHRRAYPQLRATFAARGSGDSNLKEIAVSMPHSEFLAQEHIKSICTRAAFNANKCPADSAYGSAVAYTPLFDKPLRGKVYLRSSVHKLPDLVASLYSGAIHIVLEGKVGSTKQGGIRVLFSDLPDEPLERFTMTLNGGSGGLLVNSADICKEPPAATVRALGQNNLGRLFTSTLRGQCKHKKKPRNGHGRKQ